MKLKTAVMHGRFQPFHLGHLRYAELCFEKADELVIGITNPAPGSLVKMEGDDHRHLADANPFTYLERARIIRKSLQDIKIPLDRFIVVPFPIEDLKTAMNYFPHNAIFYLRDRGDWTRRKVNLFQDAGLQPVVLDNAELLEINGSEIRNLIRQGNPEWKKMVSSSAIKEIYETGFYENH